MASITGCKPQSPRYFDVAGIGINVLDMSAALTEIRGMMFRREAFTVFTLNLDHIAKMRNDPLFRAVYDRATLVTADGFPIVWAGRLNGVPVQRTTGSDLVVPLCREAAKAGLSVALFGSTPHSLETAKTKLQQLVPTLKVVACIAPSQNFDPTGQEADATIESLAASGASLCFVGLGAPKQEIFAARASSRIPAMGLVCTGAAVDFLAGTQTRAPHAFRRANAEWLWRLAGSPGRLAPRYAKAAAQLPAILVAAVFTSKP